MKLTTLIQSQKLKEWGAPQDTGFYRWINMDKQEEATLYADDDIRNATNRSDLGYSWQGPKHTCAAYDLESLIEWLGDDGFGYLGKIRKEEEEFFSAHSRVMGSKYRSGWGKTPLEAVYNLCEALFDTKLTSKEGEDHE